MEQGTQNIIQNALALEKLERVWNYLTALTYEGVFGERKDDLFAAQRVVIAAQAKCRARIANHINGKVFAPDASWNLTERELPPHYLLIPFNRGSLAA